MAPKFNKGKVFMQDKEKLLHLAETISAGKELDIQHKIDRTKATAALDDKLSKEKDSGRRKRGSDASEKLRAAKALVAARLTRHKREKLKARKRQVQASKSDVKISRESGASSSAGGTPGRRRVAFA